MSEEDADYWKRRAARMELERDSLRAQLAAANARIAALEDWAGDAIEVIRSFEPSCDCDFTWERTERTVAVEWCPQCRILARAQQLELEPK